MGYFMRFIINEEKAISLDQMIQALHQVDAKYNLTGLDREKETADLCFGKDVYGEIEINRAGGSIGKEEIEELLEQLEDGASGQVEKVKKVLRNMKSMIVVRVLWGDREPDETLIKIDPLWDWLFQNYNGLLQADGEGYYDASEQILSFE